MLIAATGLAAAQDVAGYRLTIKDHKFTPESLEIPADTKVTLVVKNEDSTPEEFDSHDLKREKVVGGGREVTILIGPLDPGSYAFMGEYHEATAKGVVIVK